MVSALVPQAKFTSQLHNLAVPQPVASTLGMVVREVALNVAKHSGAENVDITLTSPEPGGVLDLDLRRRRRLRARSRCRSDASGSRSPWSTGCGRSAARPRSSPLPGQGTVVNLSWVPGEQPAAEAEQQPRRRRSGRMMLDIPDLSRPLLARLVWVLVGLQFLLGWTSLDQVTSIWPVFVAQALAAVATWLTLRHLEKNPMDFRSAVAVIVLLLAVTMIVQAVLPSGHWPGYATWHSNVVMVLLVAVLVRGQERVSWTGVGLFAVISAVWAVTHDDGRR